MILMSSSIIGKHGFQYNPLWCVFDPLSSVLFFHFLIDFSFLIVCPTTPFMSLDMQSWDWTSNHLIRQICEHLESRFMEGSAAAIIILLGQLGRYCLIQMFPYTLLNMKIMTACCGMVSLPLMSSI